jgi:branched-chain amino acid transport system ATP-binding protein
MSPLLQVEGVRKTFGGLHAVDQVDFDVAPGEIVGVIGPNGAGKTTLLNCISGTLRPDRGRITFDGKQIERRRPHRIAALGISRTLQLAEHFKAFTVLDYVLLGRQQFLPHSVWLSGLNAPGVLRAEQREARIAREFLDKFELGDKALVTLGELPYGTQRLVDVVRALAAEPRLVLFDEPTSGSSLYERQALRQHMHRIRAEGVTALLVDHDVGFVSDCCDRLVAMALGRSIYVGSPAEVLAQPEVIESYLGVPAGEAG